MLQSIAHQVRKLFSDDCTTAGVLYLFCLVYLVPKEKSIIFPQCTTSAFSLPKIEVVSL